MWLYIPVVVNELILGFNGDYLARLNELSEISVYRAKAYVRNPLPYRLVNVACASVRSLRPQIREDFISLM